MNHSHVNGTAAHHADSTVELLREIRDTLKAIAAAQAVPPQLVTEQEAARLLGVSPRTVWALADAGELPAVYLAGRVKRYALADLESFVAKLRDRRH